MAKFTVEYESKHPVDSAFTAVKGFLSKESEIKKFDAKAQVQFDDAKKSAKITGSQFKADMSVIPHAAGSKVAIIVDLPMLLLPFKSKIQESLQKMLRKHLA